MPPKNPPKRTAPRHGALAPDEGTATGYMKATYETLTARENFGVLRAVGIFGVCVLLSPGIISRKRTCVYEGMGRGEQKERRRAGRRMKVERRRRK